MLLTKLVFLAVKDVLFLDDIGFTYEAFKAGQFDNDPDYKTNINNVYSPLNEAIQRLSDLDRIPLKVKNICDFKSNPIDFDTLNLSISFKDVEHIFTIYENGYYNFGFTKLGAKKFLINEPVDVGTPIYIEYKEDIPYLDNLTKDFDLKERYGIHDGMCNYIIEYVKGKLLEPIDPTQANLHVTRAEQYFNNLKANANGIKQDKVKAVYGVNN